MDAIHGEIAPNSSTVLIFNEIATEKRIRWDPKTNYFIGLFRERLSMKEMKMLAFQPNIKLDRWVTSLNIE